ncbi:MAG: sulfatase-like hydrolase/transferase [bacterium]|nr:sulfatase-like hydrolase/transferase [bacterium]
MNFILLNPDELRAESVGCYGHPVVQTPNLDRLAASGTRFDQCHVQHTVCTPSRCSFMTGLYSSTSGHRTLWHTLHLHEPHLFRYLNEAGYDIRWYGKNDLLTHENIAECITEARSGPGGNFGEPMFEFEDPEYYTFLQKPFEKPLVQHGDTNCYRRGIDFLKSKPDRPFCLFLPTSYPHPAYSAPSGWHEMYDPDELPDLRPVVDGKPDFHTLIRQYRRLDQVDGSVFRRIQAVYLGMTSYVDHLIGELLDTLEETELAEDTAVIFFSDHGDWAGDYGLVEKWPSGLDDTLTRVPLIVRMPGGKAGHVVGEPVEVFDMMATVLDLAGIEAQHTHFAQSLVPQLKGAPGDPDRAVFADGGYARFEPRCFEGGGSTADWTPEQIYYPKGLQQQEHPLSVCRASMVRTLEGKLIYRPEGMSELYDLKEDPRELRNVYGDSAYGPFQQELTLRLLDRSIQCSDTTPFDEDPRGLPRKT